MKKLLLFLCTLFFSYVDTQAQCIRAYADVKHAEYKYQNYVHINVFFQKIPTSDSSDFWVNQDETVEKCFPGKSIVLVDGYSFFSQTDSKLYVPKLSENDPKLCFGLEVNYYYPQPKPRFSTSWNLEYVALNANDPHCR